jgi:hypothetical protein
MTYQRAALFAHHRTLHGGAVADIEVNPAKRVSRTWQLGDIRQIEKMAAVR